MEKQIILFNSTSKHLYKFSYSSVGNLNKVLFVVHLFVLN